MKNNASLFYNLCLVAGDFLALVAAFGGAYILRVSISNKPVAHPIHALTYVGIFLGLLPFWILIFALIGLYNQHIYEKRFNELGRLLVGSFVGLLFVVFWNFLSVNPIFPAKLVPIYGFILSFLFLVIFRNFARYIRTQLFSFEIGLNNVIIIGNTPITHELIQSLIDSRESGYRILSLISQKTYDHKFPGLHHYVEFNEALVHIKKPIHTIIQTELYDDEVKNQEVLEYAQTHHVAYRFVPGNTELFVGNIDVELFRNSLPVIAVHQTALVGWGRVAKRLFDVLVSLLLLILTSPILLLITLANSLTSRGPIFFRQMRLTRFDQKFTVYKVRTLKYAYNGLTPEEAFTKMNKPELIKPYREVGDHIPNDPRYTKFGRFLYKTGLDELPQLFNVLCGDLSLVGPRALVPEELSMYAKRHTILSVKSGLTGLAQVSGRRSISFEEKRKLDLYYVQNWTFWLDLIILAKTVRVIIESFSS